MNKNMGVKSINSATTRGKSVSGPRNSPRRFCAISSHNPTTSSSRITTRAGAGTAAGTEYLEQQNEQNFWKKAGRASRSGAEDQFSRIGYDLDGVISSERGVQLQLKRRILDSELIRRAQAMAKCLKRPKHGVIISCRPEAERAMTEEWLLRHGISLLLVLCANSREKAHHINRLKLTHYHENQRGMAFELAMDCPRTSIYLTGEIRG